jgi:perosamine synthetase
MVVMSDTELLKKTYHLKTQAVSPEREYWHDMLGFNYRMTNICAAIGLAQLEHVNEILEKKRRIALWYDKYLPTNQVRRQSEPANTRHSWWLYSILVSPEHRDDLRAHLRKAGIETRPLFPPVHTMPHCLHEVDFPVARSLSEQGISLPSYPGLEEEQVEFIARTIFEFLKRFESVPSNIKTGWRS